MFKRTLQCNREKDLHALSFSQEGGKETMVGIDTLTEWAHLTQKVHICMYTYSCYTCILGIVTSHMCGV